MAMMTLKIVVRMIFACPRESLLLLESFIFSTPKAN
jgi:hypothetical protein